MLSPRFLRLYAQKCLRTARSSDDPKTIVEFEAMARDLSLWAREAEIDGNEANAERARPDP
jgi:hypothetical protein